MIPVLPKPSPLRSTFRTIFIVLGAGVLIYLMWQHYLYTPWTRDGRINAEVVDIAPEVADKVVEILVKDNQWVKKGDVLVRIDPERYQLALNQAEAVVSQRQHIMLERQREATRRGHLFTAAVISREESESSGSTAGEALADYHVAVAQRDLAKLNLERTTICSPVNGFITNLHLRTGDYATPGKPLLSVVDTDSYWVAAYMEETKLPSIHEGDLATIKLMGPLPDILGHVESVSQGISDANQSHFAGFANVDPVFSWVRLAQRIPVRIVMDKVPTGVRVVAGQTCTVVVTSVQEREAKPFGCWLSPRGWK